jgi:hypothetical protein
MTLYPPLMKPLNALAPDSEETALKSMPSKFGELKTFQPMPG